MLATYNVIIVDQWQWCHWHRQQVIASDVDTAGKFTAGIIDNRGKFIAVVTEVNLKHANNVTTSIFNIDV